MAWTRLFIVSAVAGLPDTDATAERLLQNQADIGDAVADFYGDEAGAALTALLRDHILIAGDLVAAAKAGDDDQGDRGQHCLVRQRRRDRRPSWPAPTRPGLPKPSRDMMRVHLDQTLAEATAQLTGDYAPSVAEYDHIVTPHPRDGRHPRRRHRHPVPRTIHRLSEGPHTGRGS